MELTGERLVPATRAKVWAALNDAGVLKRCIPGCEALDKQGDDRFTATVSLRVGPVKATMDGEVVLSNIDAPNGYMISGKGKGAAGFASGDARVTLTDKDGGTHLSYAVTAKIGGKLAEVGARFVDSTARKMADQFFDSFVREVAGGATETTGEAASAGGAWKWWGAVALAVAAAAILLKLLS